MPRILEVELLDYLVNTCMPGDDITVTGIIKVSHAMKITNSLLHLILFIY